MSTNIVSEMFESALLHDNPMIYILRTHQDSIAVTYGAFLSKKTAEDKLREITSVHAYIVEGHYHDLIKNKLIDPMTKEPVDDHETILGLLSLESSMKILKDRGEL